MEAYFDNSATTRVFDCVKDVVVKTMTEDYGNAASKHRKGVDAERYIREARSVIAKSLKVQDKEIIFTSGGSESNNMALVGGAMANRRRGGHIISTNVEHPSVYNTLGFLEEQGFEITYLPVDGEGHINLSQLRDSLRQDTILVSVMYVNNEVGSVEPVEEMKNKSSRRTLPLPGPVREMLGTEKEKLEIYRKMFGKSYDLQYLDYVCVDQLGRLIRPSYVTQHFSDIIKKYGLRKLTFHGLRHTMASILISHDVPLINVSNFLGHSDISTTANIYAHLDKASKQASADIITDIFKKDGE